MATILRDRSATTAQTRPRRRLRAGPALLTVVATLLVAGAVWWFLAGSRLAAVEVAAVGNGVTCSRGQVVAAPGDVDDIDGTLAPSVQATPGLDCAVRLVVLNTGGSAVQLERLVVPVMGPRTGAAVQVVSVSPFGEVTPDGISSEDGGIDAVIDLDMTLPAGAVQAVTLQLAFNDKGCNAPGTIITPSGPEVSIRAWGRTAVRQPPIAPFTIAGTAASNCPRAE